MYASPFEYVRAGSWAEAVERLADGGEEARAIAGGQSLAPMMMARIAEPPLLVDVNDAGSRAIERVDGRLVVDALARHVDLEGSGAVRAAFPALAEAAGRIGNVRVRHRGTLGGSLAHADAAAEYPCVAVAAGARITALGPAGERTIPAGELVVGHFTTTLEPGELITRVELPALGPGQGCAFEELARRAGDFALAEACAVVELDGDGRCAAARLVIGATADRPQAASAAAQGLVGEPPGEPAAGEAGREAAAMVEIGGSAHGSEDYRREMVAVLAKRALLRAARRAREGITG